MATKQQILAAPDEFLGSTATQHDAERFVAAVESVLSKSSMDWDSAVDLVWDDGDFLPRVAEILGETRLAHPTTTGPDYRDQDGQPAQLVTCPDCGQLEWWTAAECQDHGHCRASTEACWCLVNANA